MRKTENGKKSRKLLLVATALTILALASVLLTASVLLGTVNGVAITSVLVVGSILLGILYIRLLLSQSLHTSNYRCPNPECRKIFHTPIKVRDYSNKIIRHQACPECGYDLGFSSNKKAFKENIIEKNAELKAQEFRDRIENRFSKTNMQYEKAKAIKMDSSGFGANQGRTSSKTNNEDSKRVVFESKKVLENMAPVLPEIQSPMIITQSGRPEGSKNTNLRLESESPKYGNHKIIGNAKKEKPAGCNNYFGYLGTLPKGGAMPDECYACARLIDCYKESTCDS